MSARILIVDDDKLLREVAGDYLSENDYEVDLAESGEEAMDIFEAGKYQLAVIDMVMPGSDGIEVMREMIAADPKLFCILMTGYATVENVCKAVTNGVSDYIIKPFQLSELLEAVQKYI